MKRVVLCILLLTVMSVLVGAGVPDIRVTLLNQDPNPARAGDTVNLRFKVENAADSPAQHVEIELVENYPFTVASGDAVKKFDALSAYQKGKNYADLQYIVKIDRDAMQGQKQLTIRYRYGEGVWTSIQVPVAIESKEFAQIIYVDKAKLEPGKETDMKFTITNIGNAPLQNMIFSWEEPTGAILPVYSSDMKYVRYLDTDQSVDLTYKVIADVNAKPGLYKLTLNLKSESTGNTSPATISTKAGVFVGGETDFDVAFSESSLGQTSLSVANTGNNPAQSVSVKIPSQESFKVSGSNSAIIGNLDKGDYTIVSFQIVQSTMNISQRRQFQEPATERRNMTNNNLKVEIDYTDTTGERKSINKTVPIQFRQPVQQGTTGYGLQQANGFISSTSFWIVLGSALVLLFLRKRERRAKILGLFSK
ncbi:hypothetical protein HY639_06115 [Candidatus Woesearchaeota archaeon]|nr:hypothetical protein [Candidatus Woesearchaeota archaeon]